MHQINLVSEWSKSDSNLLPKELRTDDLRVRFNMLVNTSFRKINQVDIQGVSLCKLRVEG